jgi:hypothetical protein
MIFSLVGKGDWSTSLIFIFSLVHELLEKDGNSISVALRCSSTSETTLKHM